MYKTLYLVRHAEPYLENGEKKHLTDRGVQQARATGRLLLQEGDFTTILHSPSLRCQQTAHFIASQTGGPRVIEEKLRFKNADRLKQAEIRSKFSMYLQSYEKFNIESPEKYIQRFKKIVAKHNDDTLIIVGNEANLLLLKHSLRKQVPNSSLPHGSITKIKLKV